MSTSATVAEQRHPGEQGHPGDGCDPARGLGPAAGWQGRFLGWLNRRKRLSVLAPVAMVVLVTPHTCPFC